MNTLARWVLAQGFDVSQAYVFVPNSHSALALKNALAQLLPHQSSLLLPRIFILGKLSREPDLIPHVLEDEEPIKTQKNHTFTNSLIKEWLNLHPENSNFSVISAFQDLLEASMKEEVDWHKLPLLIPDSLAKHRQLALAELEELISLCEKITQKNGRPEFFYERWFQNKLSKQITRINRPIVLAGTTASQPGTWRLMQAIFQNPQGHIVLHGFDAELTHTDESPLPYNHPQAILQRRVYELGVVPAEIPHHAEETPNVERATLASNLLGFQTTNHRNPSITSHDITPFLQGFHIGIAKNEREEQTLVTTLAKAAIHNGAESVGIVTPLKKIESYALALETAGIPVGQSHTIPLILTAAGRLVMDLLAIVQTPDSVAIWLSILRNPETLATNTLHHELDKFEERVLRDFSTFHNPSSWFRGSDGATIAKLIHFLKQWAQPLKRKKKPVSQWAQTLLETLDALRPGSAKSDLNDNQFIVMREHIDHLATWKSESYITFENFEKLLNYILNIFHTQAPPASKQNHVFLLDPLDIRLLQFDTIILTHFNDGHWPRRDKATFWLSEKQKQELGFIPSDATIGQSAHDFLRSFSCKNVIVTRSTFDQGNPTDPSPWLLRLEANSPHEIWEAYHAYPKQALKAWSDYCQAAHLGAPKPPLPSLQCGIRHKPKIISATRLERLIQNPFQFFVTQILKIQELQPFGNIITPSRYGDIVHSIMDQFAKHPDRNWEATEHIANDTFTHFSLNSVQASRILITLKGLYRKFIAEIFDSTFVLSEAEGAIELSVGEHTLTLKAKADRIDIHPDQTATIIDYKTGMIPTQKSIHNLESIQLLLEALLISHKGFADITVPRPRAIEYRQAKIGSPIIKSTIVSGEKLRTILNDFAQMLPNLLGNYLNDTFEFSYVHQDRNSYNPFAHLARYGEFE